MKLLAVIIVAVAFGGGMSAQAQLTTWGWWGAINPIPISAAHPLPVACQ